MEATILGEDTSGSAKPLALLIRVLIAFSGETLGVNTSKRRCLALRRTSSTILRISWFICSVQSTTAQSCEN